jgi:hypothetical protein
VSVTLNVENLGAVRDAFRKYGDEARKGVSDALEATAVNTRTGVQRRIQNGPKTGRVYARGGGQNLSRTHQASAPGEAPATDTGVLVSSVYLENTARYERTVGSRLAYAYYLEFGTQRIKPRPAWVPEVEKQRPEMRKRIERALAEAMK